MSLSFAARCMRSGTDILAPMWPCCSPYLQHHCLYCLGLLKAWDTPRMPGSLRNAARGDQISLDKQMNTTMASWLRHTT
jgi:hypothetical protein